MAAQLGKSTAVQLTIELKSGEPSLSGSARFACPGTLLFLEEDARKLIGRRAFPGAMWTYFMTYRNLRSDAQNGVAWTGRCSTRTQRRWTPRRIGTEGRPDADEPCPDARTCCIVTEAEEDQDALRELMTRDHERRPGRSWWPCARGRARSHGGRTCPARWTASETDDRRNRGALSPDGAGIHSVGCATSIAELIGQNVDETRLLTEVAVMADRSAIAEETVRLKSHIWASFGRCFEKDGARSAAGWISSCRS